MKKRKQKRSVRWARARAQAKYKAKQLRALLIAELGGACWECDSREKLHLDHPHGKTWQPREHNQLQRMRLYYRDFLNRNLRLLCESCNCRDGALRALANRRAKKCSSSAIAVSDEPSDTFESRTSTPTEQNQAA